MSNSFPVGAVVAALASAMVFGVSSVAEQRSTKRVKSRETLSPRLLLDLARQPAWVVSIGAILIGFALQVMALRFGALALVEPILVCDLIFAVIIISFLRRRFDPVMLTGVIASSAGLATFLVIAMPSGGVSTVSFFAVLPVAVVLAAIAAGGLALGRRRRTIRPLTLAFACGTCYGFAAFVVKLVTAQFGGGPAELFTRWPIYALAIAGPLGFLLNQYAFQQGVLLTPVMAIIIACDPLISIGLAAVLLQEKLSTSPVAIVGEVVALLVMTAGIFVVAHHAPVVVSRLDAECGERRVGPVPDIRSRQDNP